MLDSQAWRFGPLATFRSGRGASVSNATVKQMVGINNTWEGGAFLTYRLKLSEEKMHQINFTGDVATSNNGTYGTLRMLWWQPLREGTLLNLGIGTGFAFLENLYYLQVNPDAALWTWIVRGCGTAVMHGGTTAILAMVSRTLHNRSDEIGRAHV